MHLIWSDANKIKIFDFELSFNLYWCDLLGSSVKFPCHDRFLFTVLFKSHNINTSTRVLFRTKQNETHMYGWPEEKKKKNSHHNTYCNDFQLIFDFNDFPIFLTLMTFQFCICSTAKLNFDYNGFPILYLNLILTAFLFCIWNDKTGCEVRLCIPNDKIGDSKC